MRKSAFYWNNPVSSSNQIKVIISLTEDQTVSSRFEYQRNQSLNDTHLLNKNVIKRKYIYEQTENLVEHMNQDNTIKDVRNYKTNTTRKLKS